MHGWDIVIYTSGLLHFTPLLPFANQGQGTPFSCIRLCWFHGKSTQVRSEIFQQLLECNCGATRMMLDNSSQKLNLYVSLTGKPLQFSHKWLPWHPCERGQGSLVIVHVFRPEASHVPFLRSVDASVPWHRRLGRGSPNSGSPRENVCPQASKSEDQYHPGPNQEPWQNSPSWASQSNLPCRMTRNIDDGCRS